MRVSRRNKEKIMLFTSSEFLLFLAICVLLYYVLPGRMQWMLLLAASYVFYFFAGRFYPVFIFVTAGVTYGAARLIEEGRERQGRYLREHTGEFASREAKRAYRMRGEKRRRRILLAGMLGMLLLLGVFKYADFVVENVNHVLDAAGSGRTIGYPGLVLPMGISFYVFQSIGYLLDVYWEKTEAQKNFLKYMLFISFFPQLVQGPISRYADLSQTLYGVHSFDKKKISFGMQRILWGYFKKLVVADTILTAVETLVSDDYYSGAWVLIVMAFYGIELYADFTGGIDITIGIAQMFGIELQENFIRPYFSKNITEYWRRWHISMGTWFRDYVFYPLSISPGLGRLSGWCRRHLAKGAAKRVPVYAATLVTWLATGIWHGASWNFVVWGVLNGVVILISGELKPLYEKFHKQFPRLGGTWGFRAFQIMRTFLLMSALRLFDCYGDVGLTLRMFFGMFREFHISVLTAEEFVYLGPGAAACGIVAAGVLLMLAVSMAGRNGSVRERLAGQPYVLRFGAWTALLFAVLLFGSYGVGYDPAQFIYNRF